MSEDQIKFLLKNHQHRRDFIRKGLFSLAAWPILIGNPIQAMVQRRIGFSDYPFQLGHTVDRRDVIIFEIQNYDEDNAHTLTCIITREKLKKQIHEITEGEKARRKKK